MVIADFGADIRHPVQALAHIDNHALTVGTPLQPLPFQNPSPLSRPSPPPFLALSSASARAASCDFALLFCQRVLCSL